MPEQGKSTLTVNTPTHREIASKAKGEGKKIYEFVDEVWDAFKRERLSQSSPNHEKSVTNSLTLVRDSDIILSRPVESLLLRITKILNEYPSERAQIEAMVGGVEERLNANKGPSTDHKSRSKKPRHNPGEDGRRGA